MVKSEAPRGRAGTENLNKAMQAVRDLQFGETYVNRENFEAM